VRLVPLFAVLLLAPFADAIAQEQPLQPGQRVRVTVPSLDVNKHKTTFQRLHGDTLVFSSASYAVSDVTRLDVHSGRKSHTWAGAGIGFLVGAVGGGIAGHQFGLCEDNKAECALGGAGVFGLGGSLLGAAVGGFVWKTDKWQEVPLDRLRVSVVPTRNGIGIGARIAF